MGSCRILDAGPHQPSPPRPWNLASGKKTEPGPLTKEEADLGRACFKKPVWLKSKYYASSNFSVLSTEPQPGDARAAGKGALGVTPCVILALHEKYNHLHADPADITPPPSKAPISETEKVQPKLYFILFSV